MSEKELPSLAAKVADALAATTAQLVLAESCTAGLAAATLGAIPGISRYLCGSAVVYQEATKTAWLGVDPALLAQYGAVSAEVATAMVTGALTTTPHATVAAAITGHLGPGAPPQLDGKLFIAIQRRDDPTPQVFPHQLTLPQDQPNDRLATRSKRQFQATALLLSSLYTFLER